MKTACDVVVTVSDLSEKYPHFLFLSLSLSTPSPFHSILSLFPSLSPSSSLSFSICHPPSLLFLLFRNPGFGLIRKLYFTTNKNKEKKKSLPQSKRERGKSWCEKKEGKGNSARKSDLWEMGP
jgi:hypothetical protein